MLITIATKSTDTDSETDNQNSTALHQAVKKPILKLKSATKAPDQTFRKNKKCAIENLSSDTENIKNEFYFTTFHFVTIFNFL